MASSDPKVRKADEFFSLLVRRRDGECRVCAVQGIPRMGWGGIRDLECHHLIKRRYRKTRFVLDNGIACCIDHHEHFEKHPRESEAFAIAILGEQRWEELRELARDTRTKVDMDAVLLDLKARVAA